MKGNIDFGDAGENFGNLGNQHRNRNIEFGAAGENFGDLGNQDRNRNIDFGARRRRNFWGFRKPGSTPPPLGVGGCLVDLNVSPFITGFLTYRSPMCQPMLRFTGYKCVLLFKVAKKYKERSLDTIRRCLAIGVI